MMKRRRYTTDHLTVTDDMEGTSLEVELQELLDERQRGEPQMRLVGFSPYVVRGQTIGLLLVWEDPTVDEGDVTELEAS